MQVGVRGAFVPEEYGLESDFWKPEISTPGEVIAINQKPHQPHADVVW